MARSAGTISSYREPSGAGVRVDASAYAGLAPAPEYDPLLAKVRPSRPVLRRGVPWGYAPPV